MRRHTVLTVLMLSFLFFIQNGICATKSEERLERSKSAAFRLLLTDEQRALYDAISDSAAKAQWEHRFWKALDPTPTTSWNERYEEHIHRFEHSQTLYSNIIPPLYMDDRARYYIKYGAPSDFVQTIGLGREYRNNETWVYYNLNLFVDFVDFDTYGYREVNDLSEAIEGGPQNQRASAAIQLYMEREDLHPTYSKFREILRGQNARNRLSMTSIANQFYTHAGVINQAKQIALTSAPPHEYRHDYKVNPLSANLQCANYRDQDKKTRVEIYYAVPLNEINFAQGETYPYESFLEQRVNITDQDYNELVNTGKRIPLIAGSLNEVQRRTYVNQHSEILPPGLHNLALRLENPPGNRLAILKAQCRVYDYSGDDLALSDPILATHVREGARGQYVKQNGLQVVPHVSRVVKRSRPLYLYFEIYNLKQDEEGLTKYAVSYSLQTRKPEGNIFSLSFAKVASVFVGGEKLQSVETSFIGQGTSEFQQIYLHIDFSESPPGDSELHITITDQISLQEAEAKIPFVLEN